MFNFGPHLLIIFGLRHETAFAVEVCREKFVVEFVPTIIASIMAKFEQIL